MSAKMPIVNHSVFNCPKSIGLPCSVCEWLEKVQKEKKS